MKKIEILAPAGSFESVVPAVRMGADAVYLGASHFSARAGAENFNEDFLKQAVDYCHSAGVKVHLTLNTLLSDKELPKALEIVQYACTLPIDAIIVQDMGLAQAIKMVCPKLPIHGSTQMSVHTLGGAKLLYNMGFSRVVLSREMTKEQIRNIVENCPIETEAFVHGALCMSVSGQCLFSAMLGSRSGNRGKCAQPCRLPFSVTGEKDRYDLSLKDMCILNNLQEMQAIGVTSAKIEGRMKRPEYVAMAVASAKESRDNGRVSKENMEQLQALFSRQGFTDGYYTGKIGKDMFGMRSKDSVTSATDKLFATVRNKYRNENPRETIAFTIDIQKNEKTKLTAVDENGNIAEAYGNIPQIPQRLPLSVEKCEEQLKKTGGTIFKCNKVICNIQPNLTVPISEINSLRRSVLDDILEKRRKKEPIPFNSNMLPLEEALYSGASKTPTERLRFLNCNIPENAKQAEFIFVPLKSPIIHVKNLLDKGYNMAVEIPRGMFGIEQQITEKLTEFKKIGIQHVMANNLGAIFVAKQLGFTVHGGFGLNIFNTQALLWAEKIGLADVELSLELTVDQINSLGGNIPRGIIGYGYLPLMLTKNCPVKNASIDCKTCKINSTLTDRKNEKFPIVCDGNCTEILNCVPLYIYDRIKEFKRVNFTSVRFTVENYVENVEILDEIRNFKELTVRKTRGLYYRGVK